MPILESVEVLVSRYPALERHLWRELAVATGTRLEARTPDEQPSGVFVGRRRELEELLGGLEDARSGRGRLFLVSGEPGIGKSRLADEVGDEARRRGYLVLRGRSWEAGGAPAYWPWVQPIRSYVREADPESLPVHSGPRASAVAQMVPEIREFLPDLPTLPPLDPDSERFRMFDATSVFLRNVAEDRPMALLLDDLHAADTPSLLLLEFIASNLAESRIAIVAGYRDVDPTVDFPLRATLAQLARERITRFLPLEGLSQSDLARYVELATGTRPPGAMVAAIHSWTEGNPLFVVEVVRLLADEGRLAEGTISSLAVPAGIREVIGRRLRHLPDETIGVLRVGAILGREFDLGVLKHVAEKDADDLIHPLSKAARERVITDMPGALGRMRFSHALIREAIYQTIPGPERMRLHHRAAEAIEFLHSETLDSHLTELAHHYFLASSGRQAESAVRYARQAGERALRLLAYEEAVRLFEMALGALPPPTSVPHARLDLLLALGDARARAGDGAGARESFLEAADLAASLGPAHEELARAALGYGGRFVWARAGTDRHLVPFLRKALSALGKNEGELRIRVQARLAGALRDEPSREPRTSLSAEALELARRLGEPATLAYALDGRIATLLWPENPDERVALATELVELSEAIGDQEKTVQGRYYRLMAQLELGDLPAVRAELDVIDLLTRELRQPAQLWLVAVTRATLALFEGRLEEAEELIPRALSLGERAQSSDATLSHRTQLFTLARERGTLTEVEQLIRRSVGEYPARPMFGAMLTLLLAETGRLATARRELEALAASGFEALPLTNEWLFSMGFLADAAAILGDEAHADTMYELLLPYASFNATTADYVCTGSVARSLGVLATSMSRWEVAERHLQHAVEVNEEMGAPPWTARSKYDLTRMLLARDKPGDPERAAELLGAVLDTCARLGLQGLEGAARLLGGEAVSPSDQARARPSVFRREGDYWSVAFEGKAFRIRDLTGLRYLARLLSEPGREFHALDLAGAPRGGGTRSNPELRPEGDLGPILDERAKAEYRQRLRDLDDEIEEGQSLGDFERTARATEERDALGRELARAIGLRGRDRRAGSASERARASVTRAIRTALARIREHDPSLGRHLDLTVRTGTFCSYTPDPRAPVEWRL